MTKEVTDTPSLRHSDHTRGFVLGARQKQLMWGRNSKPDPPKNIKGTEHSEAGQKTGELWPLDANTKGLFYDLRSTGVWCWKDS